MVIIIIIISSPPLCSGGGWTGALAGCVLVPSDAGRAFLGGGNIGPLPHIPAVAAVAPFGRFIKCCSRYRAAIMETAVGIEQHHAV